MKEPKIIRPDYYGEEYCGFQIEIFVENGAITYACIDDTPICGRRGIAKTAQEQAKIFRQIIRLFRKDHKALVITQGPQWDVDDLKYWYWDMLERSKQSGKPWQECLFSLK